MKFRFCGDSDCPDWILAEIHSTLSVLSSIKLKVLTQIVVKSILGDEINENKVKNIFNVENFDETPKTAFSCLNFLLLSAARYNTDVSIFEAELQQLGLPKEHATSLCRVFLDHSNDLQNYLNNKNLQINELDEVSFSIPTNAIDCGQFIFKLKNEISNGIRKENSTHTINIHKNDVAVLLDELLEVRKVMEKYDHENRVQ